MPDPAVAAILMNAAQTNPVRGTEPASAGAGTIPTRSRAQAMEWGLVLLSQGIESTIRREDSGWQLGVRPETRASAARILRLYRVENRRAARPQTDDLASPAHPEALLWGLALVLFHAWTGAEPESVRQTAMMHPASVQAGEWWRLITAMTLHADTAHLVANVTFGCFFLSLAAGPFGLGPALLGAFAAGVIGNALGYLLHPAGAYGLGASGMVMGALGLLAVSAWTRHPREPARILIRALLGGMLLFVLLGLSPGTDWVAHAGGFVGGVGLGLLLACVPPRHVRAPLAQGLGLGLTLGLTTWAWYHVLAR